MLESANLEQGCCATKI